jgi:hypothetical protein
VRGRGAGVDGGQWAAAYYLAGYAIECGLKSRVLAYVEKNADIIYREKKYSENCWTHDIGTLVKASGLDAIRLAESNANPGLRRELGARPEVERDDAIPVRARVGCKAALRSHHS